MLFYYRLVFGWFGGGLILARWIRLSEILAWDRNYHLTHVILPRMPPVAVHLLH